MSFWYLGSPYSKHPGGLDKAHEEACMAAAKLIAAGVPVFSPVAHSHSIAFFGNLDARDHGKWMPVDEPLMRAAHGLIVLMIDFWRESRGLQEEIAYFTGAKKPVVYMTPHFIPLIPITELKL